MNETAVSLGYDRIRFIAPVYLGDTVTITYRIHEIDEDRRRSRSEITVTNQDGTIIALMRGNSRSVNGTTFNEEEETDG